MLKFLVISGPGSDYHIGYLILDTSFGQRGAISPEAFVIISWPSCVGGSFCDGNVLSFFTVGVEEVPDP